jgi:hypothetical protein
MYEAIGVSVLYLAVIITSLYLCITHKFMRRPFIFIVIGFILCVFSAFTIFIFDNITSHFQSNGNKSMFDIIKNAFMFSIVSLGGGLISSGLINKAQIAHERHIKSKKNRLIETEDRLQEIYKLIEENKEVWSQEEIDYFKKSAIRNELRKIMITSEIEENEY